MLALPWLLAQETVAKTDYWSEEFFGLDRDQRFILLLVLVGCLTAAIIVVTAVFSGVYHSLNRRRLEADFKQDLLDRGLSAEEMVDVIKAAPVEDAASRWVESWCAKKKSKNS